MPGYLETLRLTGLSEAQFGWEQYQSAVRLTRAKAKGKGEEYETILFPYVIHDLLFSWYTQRKWKEGKIQ